MSPLPGRSFCFGHSGVCLMLAVCLSAAVLGCGGRVYEGRLEETRKYFEFIEKQNVNLTPQWAGQGIQFRAPKPFVVMPPPPPPKKPKEGEEPEPPPPDLRQPAFIEGGLPGLAGAWKADFPLGSGPGSPTGYLYILSNFELFLDETRAEDAANFHTVAVSAITGGLKVARPADDKWVTEKYPRGVGYNEQRAFTVAVLNPAPEIDGLKYDGTIYLAKNGEIQVVVLLLIPQGIRPLAKSHPQDVSLSERMVLAMETFVTTGQKPVKPKPGAQSGAGSGAGKAF